MKKIVLIIVMGMVMLLSACSSNKDVIVNHYDKVESTDLSSEKGGLSGLNVTEEEVKEQRGKPNTEGETENGGAVMEYDDYQYTFQKGKLMGFSLKEGQATSKGVKFGDEKSRIVELYGENFVDREQDGTTLVGYTDKEQGFLLEFLMKDGKVVNILGFQIGKDAKMVWK